MVDVKGKMYGTLGGDNEEDIKDDSHIRYSPVDKVDFRDKGFMEILEVQDESGQ